MASTLAERWKELRDAAGLEMNEFDRFVGISKTGGVTTRVESGEKLSPRLEVIERVADKMGVRRAWLAFGEEPKHRTEAPQLSANGFLLKLERLPGLRIWLENTSARLTITDLAEGMVAYDASPPRSRDDGQPFNGWDSFFADVKAGRLSGPKKLGDQSAAEALEKSQLPPSARRRLKK